MKKFRAWWAWQDEQHGAWLQRMAAQGWHLRAANWLEIYTFERGAPADRLRRYRRLLAPCVAMVVAQLLLVSQWADWGRAPLALNALNWLSLGIGAIAAYSAVQLGRRMAALKAA